MWAFTIVGRGPLVSIYVRSSSARVRQHGRRRQHPVEGSIDPQRKRAAQNDQRTEDQGGTSRDATCCVYTNHKMKTPLVGVPRQFRPDVDRGSGKTSHRNHVSYLWWNTYHPFFSTKRFQTVAYVAYSNMFVIKRGCHHV